ncbi:MAG: putative mucin/carbohydrate-binding domain-containing protein, partial [Sarcina sp.]
MKKKMIAVIGLSLVVTANSSNIAYAAPSGNAKVSNKSSNETSTQDKEFNIEFYNNLGQQALKLDFNPQTMKIEMTKQNNKLGNRQNTYMRLFLYNSKNNKVEVDKSILDGNTQNLSGILEGKSFNYGDVIGIDFKENYNPKISDGINIPNNNKMNYYKVTQEGLVPYTPDVVANKFEVTIGTKSNVNLTGEAKPNSKVSVMVNEQKFNGVTDGQGNFNIEVNDKNGFNEKTIVKVTMDSEIGSITENVKPVLIEATKKEAIAKAVVKPKEIKILKKENKNTQLDTTTANMSIKNSGIEIINGWGSSAGLVSFNPTTMEFKVSQYNEYLGHNTNKFLNIRVYNPNKGEIITSGSLAGNDNTSTLTKLLNGRSFEYGDIITISYDNSQGQVEVNNGSTNDMNTTGKSESFEITKDGLIKSELKAVSVNPLDILGVTSGKLTESMLTGKTTPNNEVTVMVGSEKFTGNANANGDFSIPIKDSEGFNTSTKIKVFAINEEITELQPTINSGVKIQNSNIQILNGWESLAGNITFNPYNMTFGVNQYNAYLGHNGNKFLNIRVYNPNKGEILYSGSFNGNDNTGSVSKLLNGMSFEYGDIITISYDNSQGKIEVNNGDTNEMNTTGKSESFEITKAGIINSTLKKISVNPLDILGVTTGKITNSLLTGKTSPNNQVTIMVGSEKFTGKANANGDFSIPIKDSEGFTTKTEIKVWAINEKVTTIYPSIKSGIAIQNSNVEFIDQWDKCTGGLKFNPITMQIQTYENFDKLYIGNNMKISVYSNETGETIESLNLNSNTTPAQLNQEFNKKGFKYGDIVKITTDSSSAIKVLNGETNLNLKNGATEYKLTEAGLVPYVAKLKVNPLEILNGTKVTKAILTGKTIPNNKVTATIGTEKFSAIANAQGVYSINIEYSTGFSPTTIIKVFSPNEGVVSILPTLSSDIKIQNNDINIDNVWYQNIGIIKFNPYTKKTEFVSGGYETNPYLPSTAEAFEIYIYNKNGEILKSMKVYGNSHPENDLAAFFNNVPYEYGEIIRINSIASSNLSISNFNNQKSYRFGGDQEFEIEKGGLAKVNLQKVDVNPFDILGSSNDAIMSGTLTGKTLKPNAIVNVKIGNKDFTGISNEKGEFSIKLTDTSGFFYTTKIYISTKGELTNVVSPVAVTNLGIGQSKLQLKDNSLGIAQTMTFNPTTMKIVNSGNSFAAQLIDGSIGKVKASLGTGNFNVFTASNNLNGATFRYGDIISIYESEETSLSDGKVMLINGNKVTHIDAISKFVSFEITPQGLVQVPNKDLTNVSALFKGNSTVNVTGKTLPNTAVKLYYGNNKTIIITSNKDGVFSTDIPLEDANVGSEVRIFINNKNLKNVVVKYDSKIFNTNNSIQIINNEAFPVINITFSPATNTIHTLVYPRDKTYAGVFYGNRMNISILNPKTGEVMKSVTSKKAGEIQSFSDELNNFKYTEGDIVKIQYDKNLVSANVIDNKKQIGNATGASEYFEITNKGLVNITDKFISVQPLDILGNGNVTKATVTGKASPNKVVTATINGKEFKATADASGKFSIDVEDSKGFTTQTSIVLSADGYIPNYIKPELSQSIKLANSYVNFYQNSYNWETTSLCSSIGFNVENNTFYVNNYKDNFGTGNSNYFTLYLYNNQGEVIDSKAFTGESTSDLSTFINGKTFKYGDVIGLKYNADIYKPMVVNANTVIGNISGEMEYFKITKEGLVRVNFGHSATTNSIAWDGSSLNIGANIATGNSESILNGNKKIVLVNSDNNVISSENATTKIIDGNVTVSGILNSTDLSKIKPNGSYSIELEINGVIMPLYVGGNIPNSDIYSLSGSSKNKLEISLKNKNYVTITSSNQISSYLDGIIKNASNISVSSLSTNSTDQNKILAAQFISRVGAKNLEVLYSKNTENANFINWVLNNSVAMQEFLSGPSPEGHTPEGQPAASYSACLQVWSNIWNTYTNSHNGFNLKLAIATALSNGGTIYAFPSGRKIGSPVERYNIFETLNAEGGMLPEFKNLDVSHLCYITNSPIANDQIIPMRNIILQNHNGLIKEDNLNNIAYTIDYNVNNPHTGASVFGPDFYGKNPRINSVWYDGGVCGATGRLGAIGEQVFGIPAVQTPQPGHNAFIWYNAINNSWVIGNAVDGWANTAAADMSSWSNAIAPNAYMIASYNLLYQAADTLGLTKSNMYLYLANTDKTYTGKLAAINEAIKENKLNLGAWIALVNLYKENPNTTIEQYNTLENNIIMTFKDYPMPMYNLLYQLKKIYAKSGSENDFNTYVNSITNILSYEQLKGNSIATAMLGKMKGDGLVDGNVIVPGGINIENVWHGQIANISINGKTNEINVAPAGSYTNPYGWGEAFKISFEKADGTVIKSLVVNHQVSHPGADIEKTFNNLKYELGDKIVINYLNSSIITAANIITKDGVVPTMNVNQPITTFYITKNGLSLVKNGVADTVSVPVTIKNNEDNALGQVQELRGEIGSNIAYNFEIPVGYKLNSVLFNGTVIYTGDNIVDAEYAIAQNKYAKNEQIEILVNKINTISTIDLKNEIAAGDAKLNSGILYTEDSSNSLKSAIKNGQEILENAQSTQVQINNAIEKIKESISSLTEWCNANQEIVNTIDNANNILTKGSIDGNQGYTKATTKALTDAINNAKKLLGNSNETSSDITNAINSIISAEKGLTTNKDALTNAITNANAKIKDGTFTSNSKVSLETAIENGKKVLQNVSATPSEVKAATIAINNAIKSLQNVATIVQKDALTNAINEG